STLPQPLDFPLGLFSFVLPDLTPGRSLTVELILPPTAPTLLHYYKHSGVPGQPEPHWYDFLYDGETGAVMGSTSITLHLTDGLRGDADLQANGRIVDPGGLSRPVAVGPTLYDLTATVEGGKVVVRWTTAAAGEGDGFVVWRAATQSGPYKPVSQRIPAASDPAGAQYSWTDYTVGVAGYWYQVETLSDGRRYGPVQAVAGRHSLFLPRLGR
ncbi:MAG: hypothetical protein D6775_09705, partial [Caldilineae bacterium]